MALNVSKLRVTHAYEQVASELEAQILAGTLRAGDPLPGEVAIAEMFGVNRSTVREGIRRLESEGLVRRISPRKLIVSLPHTRELASRHTRALRLMEVTFLELWDVALATEPLAAELAARAAGDEQIAALAENQAKMRIVVESGRNPTELDTGFHQLVAQAARNRVLTLAHEPISVLLHTGLEAMLPFLPQAQERQLFAHQQVIEAITRRDPETARTWMRRHVEDFRRGYELARLPMDVPLVPLASTGDAR